MRNIKFATGEFYHIYNRGVDKRDIFMDPEDVARFFVCMSFFNTRDPIGSVKEYVGEASKSFCAKGIVLEQFNSIKEYKSFCGTTLPEIVRKKEEEKELKYMLLE